MNGKKVLFVSSELVPYLPENPVSLMSYEAPRMVNSNGGQIRIFMPRYGNINERRHQLHEVIRLSGMNLVINDMDMPLIIKVASIPKERIQVYFIDNDEYFKRKATFADSDGNLFPDNDERAIFFAKGVVETVKKLNWSPDIIHVHGWMASMVPLYLRKYYADEPLFSESRIVTSVYGKDFEGELDATMIDKIAFDGIDKEEVSVLSKPEYNNLLKVAVDHSDAVILAADDLSDDLKSHIDNLSVPVLPYVPLQEAEEAYTNFYNTEVLK
ncbi:MAG TPA: glycogen synthase [Muricauda sp.]|uniref:starch synthase n=1 Tax=Flagellimonas aurea TaxID=2915619 RepID=A0ABS3FZD8_9FLAO|nr:MULTISPECIES: glycogen/starch synthase [Allomuricauda]MAO17848.1 glycogen synthase [Allomuricauda sp.]UBZ15527.1 glycogen/starch synthase [Allomuricauda aquimarina]MBC72444.1 glycogen synthase [Allomuricauda sp.]MBO0352514.1 glycogen/starch synthase [Allomuricauda aurea]HBU78208.1 glycogen synthase [Allomuricauda sp.]|tara:strand:- start:316 stop:1125 length:810 start_codon:yes stop_codon:yes gene_type:complete